MVGTIIKLVQLQWNCPRGLSATVLLDCPIAHPNGCPRARKKFGCEHENRNECVSCLGRELSLEPRAVH